MINLYLFSWTVFLFSTHEVMDECLAQKALIESRQYEAVFSAECIQVTKHEEETHNSNTDQTISKREDVYFADFPSLQ